MKFNTPRFIKAFVATFPLALLDRFRMAALGIFIVAKGLQQVYEKRLVIDRRFAIGFLVLLTYLIATSCMSMLYISQEFYAPTWQILYRFGVQFSRLLLNLVEVYLGFVILKYITNFELKKMLLVGLGISILAGIYQYISVSLGIPLLWSVGLNRPGVVPYDSHTGFRIFGIAGEPKWFSSYLAVNIFFLMDLIRFSKSKSERISWISCLVLAFACFWKSQSTSGFVVLAVTMVGYALLNFPMLLLAGVIVAPFMIPILLQVYLSLDFQFRNKQVLDLFLTGKVNFRLAYDYLSMIIDDLWLLPLRSFIAFPLFLIFGFGYGLNHFYASQFPELATWFTLYDPSVFVDGGGWIGEIANYGIVIYVGVLLFFCMVIRSLIKAFPDTEDQIILRYSFYSFLAGHFISLNNAVFYFECIGILLFYFFRKKPISRGL